MCIAIGYFLRVYCRVYVTQVRRPVLRFPFAGAVPIKKLAAEEVILPLFRSVLFIRQEVSDYLSSECVRYERVFCSAWLLCRADLCEAGHKSLTV
jgi:hypothetical protein